MNVTNFTTSAAPLMTDSQHHRGSRAMDGAGDAVWILTSAFIIFTMISGFGLVESGMVSRKNEANIMVKNALDVIFGGLGFWMFGFAFTFGNENNSANAFSGFGRFFTDADETEMGEVFSLYLFQASFATTATTIVSGAVAERMNLKAYMVFAFTNTITYCFPAHWVWGEKGWLKEMGVVDMGGASPVHLVGGVAGLVATLMLKPRYGRYSGRRSKNEWKHEMASPTNVLLGMFMLWWGWLGFNCGSTFGVSGGKWKLASRSAVCTLNASCGGGVFATLYSYIFLKKLDIPLFMSGILGSLVSITAICGVVKPGESLLIGFIGACIAIGGWRLLERFEIDDPVGAIPIHAGGSIWGMLAVGMFVEIDRLENTFSNTYGAFKGGHVRILGVQLLACIVISAWTVIIVAIQFTIIDKLFGLRLTEEEERLGADVHEHGIVSYANVHHFDHQNNGSTRLRKRNVVSPGVRLRNNSSINNVAFENECDNKREGQTDGVILDPNSSDERHYYNRQTTNGNDARQVHCNGNHTEQNGINEDETQGDIETEVKPDYKSSPPTVRSRRKPSAPKKPIVSITITPAD